MEKFILFGTYCDDAIKKRTPFRSEHLKRLAELKDKGILKTLGPTKCNKYVFGIFEGANANQIIQIVKDDIYWKERIWTSLDIHPWVQAF